MVWCVSVCLACGAAYRAQDFVDLLGNLLADALQLLGLGTGRDHFRVLSQHIRSFEVRGCLRDVTLGRVSSASVSD